MPYWTCTPGDYRINWKSYLLNTAKDNKFHVSPLPEYVSQISISKENVKKIISDVFMRSADFDISPKIIYSATCILNRILIK